MKVLLVLVLTTTSAFAAWHDDPRPPTWHGAPAPAPLSAPCSAELYGPGGVCRRALSTQHFKCLAAHRDQLSAACQQLLKDNGK
jgi:hypothetical protein